MCPASSAEDRCAATPNSTIGSDRCAGAALDVAFASFRNPDLCVQCSGIFRGVAATNYCRQQDERQPASLAVRHTSQHQLAYTFPALGTARVASPCRHRLHHVLVSGHVGYLIAGEAKELIHAVLEVGMLLSSFLPVVSFANLVDRARSRENRDQQVKFPTNDRVSTTRPPSPGSKPALVGNCVIRCQRGQHRQLPRRARD
jgi:hypothetical protein